MLLDMQGHILRFKTSNIKREELEELNLRSFVHKVGHGISTVAHNPIVQAAAKAGINAALDKYTEEELQELSILSSIKHGVSHVAHNPIVQAAAHAAAQAAVDRYLHEEQELYVQSKSRYGGHWMQPRILGMPKPIGTPISSIQGEELEELNLRSFVHKVGHGISTVAHNPTVQAAAKAAAQAAADKYLHEELMELKFGSKLKHAFKKVGSGIKKVFTNPIVEKIVTTGIDIATKVPEEELEELTFGDQREIAPTYHRFGYGEELEELRLPTRREFLGYK
jgi:hypothetical protein